MWNGTTYVARQIDLSDITSIGTLPGNLISAGGIQGINFRAIFGGASNTPYAPISITGPTDSNPYSYYGLTKYGSVGWSIGINAANALFFGVGGTVDGTAARNVTAFQAVTIDQSGNIVTPAGITALALNIGGSIVASNNITATNGIIGATVTGQIISKGTTVSITAVSGSTTYNALITDEVITVSGSGTAIINLLSATAVIGKRVTVLKVLGATASVTVKSTASDFIEAPNNIYATTYVLPVVGAAGSRCTWVAQTGIGYTLLSSY